MLATTVLHLTGLDLGSVRCHSPDTDLTIKVSIMCGRLEELPKDSCISYHLQRRSSIRHLMIFLVLLISLSPSS
jgi:hypothetical protein